VLLYAEAAGAKLLPPTSEMEPGSQLVVFDVVLFVGGRETPDADAASPEVLLALCLRDGFANVGLQVSARCLV